MSLDSFGDTIVALATPKGIGAVSIIRISGVEAFLIVSRISSLPSFEANTIKLATIRTANNLILDQVLIACFKAPHSYTGEDVVEINCHGGYAVANQVIDRCIEAGARLATPGEYTLRAFTNGKIDLVQAEAVIDLIQAKTSVSVEHSSHQLMGRPSIPVAALRQNLLELISHLEVHLEYTE